MAKVKNIERAEAYPHRVKISPAHAAGAKGDRDFSNPHNWAVEDSRHYWRKLNGHRAKNRKQKPGREAAATIRRAW